MAKDKSEVTNFVDALKAVGKYLLSLEGIGSTIPGALSLADISLGFLPVPAPVRPTIYFFILVLLLFAFYYECARYAATRIDSSDYSRMPKRALVHAVIGFLLCAIYVPSLAFIDAHPPSGEESLFAILWVAALIAAIGIMQITQAFVILGMKSLITRNRP